MINDFPLKTAQLRPLTRDKRNRVLTANGVEEEIAAGLIGFADHLAARP